MCFSSHALPEKEVKKYLRTPKNIRCIRRQATSLNLVQAFLCHKRTNFFVQPSTHLRAR